MAELHKIMQDLTVVYYTANHISEAFARNTKRQLIRAIGDLPLICVSQKQVMFPGLKNYQENIIVGDIGRTHLNIYRQALIGAKAAKTKYVAMAEDDVLYAEEHFKFRPRPGYFAYNVGVWGIYTWTKPPMFSYKGRRNMYDLICERELFIEAIEERFAMYPNDEAVPLESWAEPGKYEDNLGITVRKTEEFYSTPPNIVFSHESALAFDNLGTRKKLGKIRALEIPVWGRAEEIIKLYE